MTLAILCLRGKREEKYMIRPNDLEKMELGNTDFEKLEEDIDNSIKSFHGWSPWEEAIIRGEYPVSVRNAIGKKYKKA